MEKTMENAITVKDVTKIYKLYDKPIDRLKESLNPFHREYHRKFYALKHISFEVKSTRAPPPEESIAAFTTDETYSA